MRKPAGFVLAFLAITLVGSFVTVLKNSDILERLPSDIPTTLLQKISTQRKLDFNHRNLFLRNQCLPHRRLIFIKVHKAGSSTVTNVIFRFGMSHNTTFALPAKSPKITLFQTKYWENILPPPEGTTFEILCNHAVYVKPELQRLFPNDTVYMAIIREPYSQLRSSIYYFYKNRIPGEDKVKTYLDEPEKVHPSRMLNNPMSYELGLQRNYFQDKDNIQEHLVAIAQEFRIILVMEKMTESLLLMKRFLCWNLQDILFIPKNINGKKPKMTLTEEQMDLRRKHKQLAEADYMLYNFFRTRLDYQITAEGRSFTDELKHYRSMLTKVGNFCKNLLDSNKLSERQSLHFEKSIWYKEFVFTNTECQILYLNGVGITEYVKNWQYGSTTK